VQGFNWNLTGLGLWIMKGWMGMGKLWICVGLLLIGCNVNVDASGGEPLARDARTEDDDYPEPPVEEVPEEVVVEETGCSPNCPSDMEEPEWAFRGQEISNTAVQCPIRNSKNLQLDDVEVMKIMDHELRLVVSGSPCYLERRNYLDEIEGGYVRGDGTKRFWFTVKYLRWVSSHTALATICINGVYACRDIQAIVGE
jgi:hypothetical protein